MKLDERILTLLSDEKDGQYLIVLRLQLMKKMGKYVSMEKMQGVLNKLYEDGRISPKPKTLTTIVYRKN